LRLREDHSAWNAQVGVIGRVDVAQRRGAEAHDELAQRTMARNDRQFDT
jgi:hypothetical protein